MNELKIFENAEFGKVRTMVVDNEPYFLGKEIAEILGYEKPTNAIATHVDYEDKKRLNFKAGTEMGLTNLWENNDFADKTLINESGVYCLIMRSCLPQAKKFKRWVTSEVLPSIRKHGVYAIDELLKNPDMLIKSLEALKEERAKNAELEETVGIQKQQIAELQPKASYYDLILNCKEAIAISIIAKDYGMSAQRMNSILHDKGVQYKQGEIWLLKQKYADKGYTVTKTTPIMKADGRMGAKVHTYWTQKGRIFIYNLLKESDILPLIEIGMEEEEIC